MRAYSQTGFLPPGGAVVEMAGGRYELARTLELTAADSGTASGAILWRARAGEEVRLQGSRQLLPEWFTTVSNSSPVWARLDAGVRGQVMEVDLAAHGITNDGTLRQRGFGSSSTLAAWDFPTSTDRAGFSAEARVSPSALTVSGMAASAAPGHPTWAVSVSPAEMNGTNETEAVASGDYCEVTLAPPARQHVSLDSISFEHRKSDGEAGPTLFVRSSADGYSATLGSVTTAGSNVWNSSTFTLSGVSRLQDRTVPVTLRIYCYKPAGDPGTQSVSIDGLSLTGSTRPAGGSKVSTVLLVAGLEF